VDNFVKNPPAFGLEPAFGAVCDGSMTKQAGQKTLKSTPLLPRRAATESEVEKSSGGAACGHNCLRNAHG
jgi:hypothetical protein